MRLPSVTQIIGSILPCDWYTEESRVRGQAVHAALAAHLLGDWAPAIPDQYGGYVQSGMRFISEILPTITGNLVLDWKTSAARMEQWGCQLAGYQHLAQTIMDEPPGVHVERELSHRGHGYCGHPDLIRIVGDGPWTRITVRLREDGGTAIADPWTKITADWAVFVSMVNIINHFPQILKKDERYAD